MPLAASGEAIDGGRLRAELQQRARRSSAGRRPSEAKVALCRSPMRTSASARPSRGERELVDDAPRSLPAGRTRFHEQAGVGRAVERSERRAVGGRS